MSNEWAGVVSAVAPRYLKGAADLTIRKRLLLSMMESRGLITLNCDSTEQKYDVEYKEPSVEAFSDGADITFQRRDYLKQATMDWRAYVTSDLMYEREKLQAKGDTVIVDRYKRIIPTLVKGARNKLGLELYIDGNASGNTTRFHGIESFMGSGTTAAGDILAQPSDTYNGFSTAVHASGRWTADLTTKPNSTIAYDWPEGEGSPDFDYWSPKLVNTSSTGWGTGSTSWIDNCEKALRRTVNWLTNTTGADGSSLVCLMAGHMFSDFKELMSAKQRVLVPHKESEDLGFPNTLNFEGLGLKDEFGIKTNTGYVFNVDQMELCCLSDELMVPDGPNWDPKTRAWLFSVCIYGNVKWFPKFFAKLYPYA